MFAQFDFGAIVKWLPFLIRGMSISLLLTALAIAGGIAIGAILALMRLSSRKIFSLPAGFYVNFFRSFRLILVIFWFYFMVPLAIGRPVGRFYSVLIAFVIFEAAYYCEIIRAGIMSVGRGQKFAGQAIGLTPAQNALYVVLPQALRNMTPVLVTRGIVMFQDTSLWSIWSVCGTFSRLPTSRPRARTGLSSFLLVCSARLFHHMPCRLVVCAMAQPKVPS